MKLLYLQHCSFTDLVILTNIEFFNFIVRRSEVILILSLLPTVLKPKETVSSYSIEFVFTLQCLLILSFISIKLIKILIGSP